MNDRYNEIAMVLITFGLLAFLTLAGQAPGWVQAAPYVVGAVVTGIAILILIIREAR